MTKEEFIKKIEKLAEDHTKNVIKHCNREFIKFFNDCAKYYDEYNEVLREEADNDK